MMLAQVRKLQPNIILNNRLKLDGSEDTLTPESYLRDSDCVEASGNHRAWVWRGKSNTRRRCMMGHGVR